MGVLALPSNLVRNVEQSSSPELRDWFERLPSTVASLAERWSLRLGEPYQPGGTASWTAPATGTDGRDLVLKVGWTHTESRDEAAGLRAWNGDGAAYVYESHADGRTSALLLERCDPGTTLGFSMSGPDQDVVVAGVLRHLWRAPVGGPFRPLWSMCEFWADEFEKDRLACPDLDLDPGVIRAGVALFRDLPATAERQALLPTDLHAGNILAARRMPWLAVDPKPYVGDPTYDALQHLLNGDLMPDPMVRVRRMAGLLDLDPDRLRLWLFARCVVESVDNPGLRPVATALKP
jgi:streptomycin 6-kinase